MTPMAEAREPIPEHVKDAVVEALKAEDWSILGELSPEDRESAHRYLTSLQAYEIFHNIGGTLDGPDS